MNLKIFSGFERFGDKYPTEEVKYALGHKEEAIPELLQILEYTVDNAESLTDDLDYMVHFPAVHLLAYFREKKAYEGIIKLISLPQEQYYYLYGELASEYLRKIIPSVCDGDIEPIKKVIEDSSLDEFVRSEALASLLVLMNEGIITREQLVAYFKELLNGKLKADNSYIWDTIPDFCFHIHPSELIEDIETAIADGKISKIDACMDLMERQLKRLVNEVLDELRTNEDYSCISLDDINTLEHLITNSYLKKVDDSDILIDNKYEIAASFPSKEYSYIGRNDPCPCGSGKKYKKCCLGKVN